MSPQYPRRQLRENIRAAAWLGSTSLALLVGCVDAPEPATSSDPVKVAPLDLDSSEPSHAESTPVADAEPTPSAAEVPDPDGWVASPPPNPEPEPTLASSELVAEPTLAEPTPAAPRLIPGGLSSTAPTPFPTSTEPTLTEAAAPPGDPQPTRVADSGEPATNTNPKPLEAVKPKPLIHISPRHPSPLADSQVASSETPPTPSQKPAVMLPPSPSADAALLSPVKVGQSTANPEPPVTATSLASIDPKVMLPGVPVSQPHPVSQGSGIPISPVSISQSISEPPAGFTALFNNKDLTGWEVYDGNPESWQFQDGEVSCVAPGGGWLQSLELYCDFELRFEYRLSAGGNSGVCLRFPGHGNPSLEGLEIQLLDDRADKYQSIQAQQSTGSLYFVAAPQVRDAARAAGEWNSCAVHCVGDQLRVTINHQLVNEIDLSQLAAKSNGTLQRPALVRCPMGSVALQSHSTRVDFRHVHLQDLTQALASGVRWLDLQTGTGEPVPADATVTVHYLGFLSTGKRFANSLEKGKPATVPLKDVIPGWREGIPGMKVGGKRRLIVPAQLAYGAKGFKEIVPPNSTLVYEIELTAFEKPTESVLTATGNPSAQADTGK